MAKVEHALIDQFLARHHDLRHVAGPWTRWDGRRWAPITDQQLVELFRASRHENDTAGLTRPGGKDDLEDDSTTTLTKKEPEPWADEAQQDCGHAAKST